jgi:hypothetical protein
MMNEKEMHKTKPGREEMTRSKTKKLVAKLFKAMEDFKTTHELLKPRYKVIATFPFNNYFMLNEVMELNEFDDRGHLSLHEYFINKGSLSGIESPVVFHESALNLYPHLFKRLEWWEDRRPDEMPEYVSANNGDGVFKARFDTEETSAYFMYLDERGIHPFSPTGFSPATREEFEAFTSTNKEK